MTRRGLAPGTSASRYCAILICVLLGACGAATPTSSVIAPGSSGPAPTASVPVPSQTLDLNNPNTKVWPTDVIDATLRLGALDNEVKKAGEDLTKAADTSDPALMLGAAEGLADLASKGIPDAQTLAGYAATKGAGEAYLPALSGMQAAAQSLAKSLRAGDGAGVTRDAQALATALTQYGQARLLIVDLVNQAIEMQKHLVR